MNIVLASRSPRRKKLLTMIGVDFTVIADTMDEEIPEGLTPESTVSGIALQKAKNVSKFCDNNDIIIAADTLVYLGSEAISKPVCEEDAAVILKKLSGRKHTVYTGLVLMRDNKWITDTEKTDVYFREISEEEIISYIKTGEPMDKAGAYAAQGKAAVFIKRIHGDFFNVMGLPLCKLSMMLSDFCGVSIVSLRRRCPLAVCDSEA